MSQLFIRSSQPLHQTFSAELVRSNTMDVLWSHGWRHFGARFFRYNLATMSEQLQEIIALRIDIHKVKFSKSQRRNLRRNADLSISIQPAQIDDEKTEIFLRHRLRFEEYIPDSLGNFLAEQAPSTIPCQCNEVQVRDADGRLLAVSFLDIGETSASSVFAMFDPDYAERGLGTLTMLHEIEYCQRTNKRYYYPGYTTVGSSHYDYKKRFHGLEYYDFATYWRPFTRKT
ncbi:MAG: GNAT family N-acetyltransferase [Candidatus Promineifilaceae bacterium]